MEPFIGQIIMFGGNFNPRGWALCHGQLLPIAQNTALFSILGTTYGGDGRTTFALPDLRGRVAVHHGSGPGLPPVSLGERAGNATTTLNQANLPSHSHNAVVTNNLAIGLAAGEPDADDGEGTLIAMEQEIFGTSAGPSTLAANAVSGTLGVTNQNTGNNTAFSNRPPFLGVNYIIALTGTYPSRN